LLPARSVAISGPEGSADRVVVSGVDESGRLCSALKAAYNTDVNGVFLIAVSIEVRPLIYWLFVAMQSVSSSRLDRLQKSLLLPGK